MAKGKYLIKSIILLILIIIVFCLGMIWFNYIGVIHAKPLFAKFFGLFGLKEQTTTVPSSPKDLSALDLDNDRWEKRLEAFDVREEELEKRESDVKILEDNNMRIAQELQDKENSLEDREKTLNNELQKYDDRSVNIDQIVKNLEGMQPSNAVEIIVQMDDQLIIDVFRRADEKAAGNGTTSMVAYWLSLMPSSRAAEIQRKMANKPNSLF